MLLFALFIIDINKANTTTNPCVDGPKITISFEIGQPLTCLPRFSICDVDVTIGMSMSGNLEITTDPDGKGSGHGGGGGGGASWKLSFSRDNFSKFYPGYLTRIDGKNTVSFDDAFTIPAVVRKAMGATKELVVQANTPYPLKLENGLYTITFPY